RLKARVLGELLGCCNVKPLQGCEDLAPRVTIPGRVDRTRRCPERDLYDRDVRLVLQAVATADRSERYDVEGAIERVFQTTDARFEQRRLKGRGQAIAVVAREDASERVLPGTVTVVLDVLVPDATEREGGRPLLRLAADILEVEDDPCPARARVRALLDPVSPILGTVEAKQGADC